MSLKLENVSLTLSAGTPFATDALTNIYLELQKGQIIGLIGHTGSGKSSLLQVLAGLEPPSAGQVYLDEMQLYQTQTNKRLLRQSIGLSFQYPEHQLFEETIYKELVFGLKTQELQETEIQKRIELVLPMFGLDNLSLEQSPFELSGGQMRRLALASVFIMYPAFLLLDEPVAGLDPRGRKEILEAICSYRKVTGACVLLVSHSMTDVAQIADRVLIMSQGQLLCDAPPQEALTDKAFLESVGLEVPEAYDFLLQLRANGLNLPLESTLTAEQLYQLLAAYLRKEKI